MVGERYTGRNRLARALMAQEKAAAPIQSHTQGLASMLRQGLAAYMQGADSRDRKAAQSAMMKGLTAKPWTDPDTGETVGKAGGIAGAQAAMQGLGDNPYAADMMEKLGMMKYQEDRAADIATTAFERQRLLEAEKRQTGLKDMFEKLKLQDELTRQRDIEKENRAINAERAEYGLPPISSGASTQGAVSAVPSAPAQGLPQTAPAQRPHTLAEAKAAAEAQAAAAKETAKLKAEEVSMAPKKLRTANELLAVIDQAATFDKDGKVLTQHPGLADLVGMPAWGGITKAIPVIGSAFPATDAADYEALHKQMGGSQFLQAFESLKGGGTITEIEGQKAEQAIARMQTSQSEEAYLKALKEFRDIIAGSAQRAQGLMRPAGGIPTPPPGFE